MTFIAIIIALLVEKFYRAIDELRNFAWFFAYVNWMTAKFADRTFWHGPIGVVAIIIPPLALSGLVLYILHDITGLLGFLGGTALLIYSLGPQNMHEEIQAFIDAKERGDTEGALLHLDKSFAEKAPDNEQQLFSTVVENILINTSERLLAVLFWFIVLGPLGALLIRSATLLHAHLQKHHQDDPRGWADAALRLHFILFWLPDRLVALSYALSGSFVPAFNNWSDYFKWENKWANTNQGVLISTGFGALQLDIDQIDSNKLTLTIQHVREALALAWRALIVWVVVFSVLTLAGWLH